MIQIIKGKVGISLDLMLAVKAFSYLLNVIKSN